MGILLKFIGEISKWVRRRWIGGEKSSGNRTWGRARTP
jgi:hypothetical protein